MLIFTSNVRIFELQLKIGHDSKRNIPIRNKLVDLSQAVDTGLNPGNNGYTKAEYTSLQIIKR